jgi:hypothetical protein
MSEPDLQRLRNIASQPHLAQAVQKFSYLVPKLYFRGIDIPSWLSNPLIVHQMSRRSIRSSAKYAYTGTKCPHNS